MANLAEKISAELEQVDQALRELPVSRRMRKLSVLELAGASSLVSSFYHGVENILKQVLLAKKIPLPTGAAWHRDLLQSACLHGIVTQKTRGLLIPYMAFRHFFTHAYGFDLDYKKLQPLVRDARQVYAGFKTEVTRFAKSNEKN